MEECRIATKAQRIKTIVIPKRSEGSEEWGNENK